MGGSGSGRYADTYNYTVEDCLDIDISLMIRRRWLKHDCNSTGTLRWTRNEEETGSIGYRSRLGFNPAYISLFYTWKKTEEHDYKVFLTKTYPNYGGFRYWFSCPSCGKRVRKLYSAPGSGYFLCRTCQNLTYSSCRESHQFDTLFARIAFDTGLPAYAAEEALKRLF